MQESQAKLAKEHGIDGFIYYQYWFGNGKKLLEKPAENMLKNKKVDMPFCFCWANETWKGIWHGIDNPAILIEQTYEGEKGYLEYFAYLLPFFKDVRYIKVDNKPMFHIYRIEDIPDLDNFIEIFNRLAVQEGFEGIYFIATIISDLDYVLSNKAIYGQVGMDVFFKMRSNQMTTFNEKSILNRIEIKIKKLLKHTNKIGVRLKPLIVDYAKGVANFNIQFPHKKYISCVFPNWDNSARSGNKSLVFTNSNPKEWQQHLQITVNECIDNPNNPPFIIIKSWNEWAEGNYLEPDVKFGLQWLEAVKRVKDNLIKSNIIENKFS